MNQLVTLLVAVTTASFSISCGTQNSLKQSSSRTAVVNVSFVRDAESQRAYGLSDKEPAFVGLGIEQEGEPRKTIQLAPGNNTIELKTVSTNFKAALIMYRAADDSKLYYSTANAVVKISNSTTAIDLVFSPLVSSEKTSVYGVVYENDQTPAAGASI